MGRIFGTDGARGVANTEITCQLAADIARATAMILEDELGRPPRILIGRDTRISGPMLDAAICAGLSSVGADSVRVGVVPTPAVAYLVPHLGLDAGIMLSASHNPYEYNGIKIFGSQGYKLTDEEEFAIEEIVLDQVKPYPTPWGSRLGRTSQKPEAVQEYIRHIASTVEGDLSGLRVAVDCSNGSASVTAAALLEGLGAQCTFLADRPDGLNINRDCGSTHLDALVRTVREGNFHAGVAFDGDADRCLAVDETGRVVSGDQIMAILGGWLRDRGRLAGDTVVVTTMSNYGFFQFARDHRLSTQITKVGDRYVLEKMREGGFSLGGEQSGHVIFLDHMTTGDGQLTAVQLLQVMKATGRPLGQLASVMEVYPQVLVNLRADAYMKSHWETDEVVARVIQEGNRQLGETGRILVRASGTEPLIRVMVEGRDTDQINRIAHQVADTIKERLENA